MTKRAETFLIPEREYHYDGYMNFVSRRGTLRFSDKAGKLYRWMDGETPDARLAEKFKAWFGFSLPRAAFKDFVDGLQKNRLLWRRPNGCLAGHNSDFFKTSKLRKLDAEPSRKAVYAGICYPEDPDRLSGLLKECFDGVDPRRLSVLCRGVRKIRGLLVPHSNMDLSGECAAWGYAAMARYPLPDTCVILAPDHYSNVPDFSVLLKDYLTPLGRVGVDRDLGLDVASRCAFDIFKGRLAHVAEHAIEIQLPFLQHVYRGAKKECRILPVICSDSCPPSSVSQFVRGLREASQRTGRRLLVIASTDLVHAGWKNYPSFHARNKNVISRLRQGDAQTFRQHISRTKYLICSKMPIYTFLRFLSPGRGRVLRYSWTSKARVFDGEDGHNKYEQDQDIGYASMIFR